MALATEIIIVTAFVIVMATVANSKLEAAQGLRVKGLTFRASSFTWTLKTLFCFKDFYKGGFELYTLKTCFKDLYKGIREPQGGTLKSWVLSGPGKLQARSLRP